MSGAVFWFKTVDQLLNMFWLRVLEIKYGGAGSPKISFKRRFVWNIYFVGQIRPNAREVLIEFFSNVFCPNDFRVTFREMWKRVAKSVYIDLLACAVGKGAQQGISGNGDTHGQTENGMDVGFLVSEW